MFTLYVLCKVITVVLQPFYTFLFGLSVSVLKQNYKVYLLHFFIFFYWPRQRGGLPLILFFCSKLTAYSYVVFTLTFF